MNRERKQFMKSCKPVLSVLAGVLTFACIAAAADAPKLNFKFTTIDVPGSLETDTYGINNAGVIVGDYINSSGVMHGLKLVGKKVINIDDPNGVGSTVCNDINSSGEIVGSYVDSSGTTKGFRYKNRRFFDVVPPGATTFSEVDGINDKGEIAGDYIDSSSVDVGFLLKGNNYTTLNYPGSAYTLAYGINNSGWVTIQWGDSAGHNESSLYNSKTRKYGKLINVPGAANSFAHQIDTAGDIVYTWTDSSSSFHHGALCTNCTSNSPGWHKFVDDPKGPDTTRADGINDNQTIVGRFVDAKTDTFEGFKATY